MSYYMAVMNMVLNALDRDAADGKVARGEMAAELRAVLAQEAGPVVERQEPAAVYQTCNGVEGWIDVDRIRFTACQLEPDEYECRVLYTSQPAPVAVAHSCGLDVHAKCVACLEKVKELNQ